MDKNNFFLAEYIVEFLEYTRINDYTIKFKKNKLPSFDIIYSLDLVELKILKTYIKINFASSFIWYFKSPIKASIVFN